MEIAICGGGIGGLVLAYALSKYDHLQISVYEANPQLAGMGTGIGIFRRTWKILRDLGLEEEMESLCGAASSEEELLLTVRASNQAIGQVIATGSLLGGMRGAHRASFHNILLCGLNKQTNVKLYTSKRAAYYNEIDNHVELHFSDGSVVRCGVLVGADGLRSPIRRSVVDAMIKSIPGAKYHTPESLFYVVDGQVVQDVRLEEEQSVDLGSYQGAIWSGFAVYRAVIPRERLESKNSEHSVFHTPLVIYCGADKEIVAYSINAGTAVNISMNVFDAAGSAVRAPYPGKSIKNVQVNEVLEIFGSDWESEVLELFSCLEGLETSLWAINEVQELPSYAHGRVALLGDSGHAMTPYLGMGAGQAIEDAYVLAALLSHPSAKSFPQTALAAYSRIRKPFVSDLARLARRTGLYCAYRGENELPLELLREGEGDDAESSRQHKGIAFIELGKRIAQGFTWQSDGAEGQQRRALEIFERMISEG